MFNVMFNETSGHYTQQIDNSVLDGACMVTYHNYADTTVYFLFSRFLKR